MVRLIKLDPTAIAGAVVDTVAHNMRGLVSDMEKYAKDISPTDTSEYINSFKTDVDVYSDHVVWKIINDCEYASGVEFGFRRKPVDWHKWPPRDESTRFYHGVGANVQQRMVALFIPSIPKRLWSKS